MYYVFICVICGKKCPKGSHTTMLKVWEKIFKTGTVTEDWDAYLPPERSRGEVLVHATKACETCRTCVTECPVNAITHDGKAPAINNMACVFCGLCVDVCPAGNIEQTTNYKLATLGGSLADQGSELAKKIRATLGRSLHIRHVDIGSCNGCDFELIQLTGPVYDLQQYGIDFVASPRHADLLMVTGPLNRNSTQALEMTYGAAPNPKLVMALGSCACSGTVYGESHAIRGPIDSMVGVDIYVPGCPPRPQAIIHGLMLALDRL
jgi:Ni,Fe-hydrogenase III small subunit/ferredoxin